MVPDILAFFHKNSYFGKIGGVIADSFE